MSEKAQAVKKKFVVNFFHIFKADLVIEKYNLVFRKNPNEFFCNILYVNFIPIFIL